jgi:hypothetical protein
MQNNPFRKYKKLISKRHIMNKILVITALTLIATTGFTQVKVLNNNNIAIHTDNSLSKISAGNEGNSKFYFNIYSPLTEDYSRGLYVYQAIGATHRYGIVGSTPAGGSDYAFGLYGSAVTSSPSSGRSYGVFGYAGNATAGYNYGVYGALYGSNNGAGVYGTVGWSDVNVGGKWAGYFNGNVKISGNTYVNGSTLVTSDIKVKKEIRHLEGGNVEKLKKLTGIKYKLKDPEELGIAGPEVSDTISKKLDLSSRKEIYKKDRIGLSAQEIRKLYPELVEEDSQGYLAVDYTGLIPILIEAIKEQQEEIEQLKAAIKK